MPELTGKNRSEHASLDTVTRDTLSTLESAQKQIFAAAEDARAELARLNRILAEIDPQLTELHKEIALVGCHEKEARDTVAAIASNFGNFSEETIKAAYEGANELKVKLALLKEKRNQLVHRKKELEAAMTNLQETVDKSENMVSQIGIAIDFIGGNLKDINIKLESLHQRQQMGLQIIRAQEEERKRVAREIHDGPAQSMANVVLRMEFCEKLMDVDPDKVRGELRELKDIVRNNLQDVRKIIFDLRPMALDDLGVMPALKRYIEEFREKNDICIEISFRGRETRLEPALEIALFRLVQEALNNVVKHAKASNVKVSLEMKEDYVQAVVQDNGVGFILEKAAALGSAKFGLLSMKERIELLDGSMEIDTRPGAGTKVSFKIPVS